jgi:hypothetical protein
METQRYEIGMVGLGVMGRNLLLNMAGHGFPVAGYDKDPGQVEALRKESPESGIRGDQVDAAWRLLMPVLEAWKASPPTDFPNYAGGTWGPNATQGLLVHPGHSWPLPMELAGHRTGENS